ncbi:4Fe-4S dicluster domain-containing protein [uncultured Gemmiger sp.]|uniref:4Fe-4S binding protein n=1 Tax=uncultured Gemmiger sp. TaxID=1623490 RepID=UPI0025F3085C|nr:4Fe-4S dicluster domain-containing protein [uncultured Gemmiger sp.]
MRFVSIVFSPTGGTQKVADAITSAWNGEVQAVDLTDPALDGGKVQLASGDLALIAAPSFGGRVPALAIQRLRQIQGNGAKCAVVCVYGNRAYEDTLLELSDAAKEQGFCVIAGVAAVAEHSIMHQYAAGRPDAKDQEQLRAFGGQVLAKAQGADCTTPQIPGNRPYKKAGGAGLVPKADRECNGCGLCAEKCPAQAIPVSNPKSTDAGKCISCMRCVAICPQHARKLNSVMVSAAALAIKKACSVYKENELYL